MNVLHLRQLPPLVTLLLAADIATIHAQLPLVTVPAGTLRLELNGAFNPSRDLWRDGKKVGVGSLLSGPVDATMTPLVSDLDRNLSALLGHASTIGSLGTLTTTAEWQRNVGIIAAAWGVTPRLTIFGNIPIVSVRTERQLSLDATGATLGLNPGHPAFGNGTGQAQTTSFLQDFDAALTALNARINDGSYTGSTLSLAQETATSGGSMRGRLGAILGGSSPSLVLPLVSSSDAMELLNGISSLQTTLTNSLGVTGFTGGPAFPAAALTSAEFNALLTSPSGFNILPDRGQPLTGLGRIELGAELEVLRHVADSSSSASVVGWGRAVLRLGTAKDPNQNALLTLGTGGRQHQLEIGGTVQFNKGKFGVRGDGSFTASLPSSGPARIGGANQFLLPVSRTTTASRSSGMQMAISAQPWIQPLKHLSVSGLLKFEQRGDDNLSFDANTGVFEGLNADDLTQGTGASSLRVGLGINYFHDGIKRTGVQGKPTEAGFSIERVVASGKGIVPAELTGKVYLKIYYPRGGK